MATGKQEQLELIRSVKNDLLAVLVGMDYCLDWKQDSEEWSARELVYHVLDTPPGGAHNLVKGIIAGEIKEYEIWSDRTNMTPERTLQISYSLISPAIIPLTRLCEYLDRIGFTRRDGDIRVLGPAASI